MAKQHEYSDCRGDALRQMGPHLTVALSNELLALYSAISDEDHWRSLLQRFCGHLGADGMGVLPGAGCAIAAGIPAPDLEALYAWLSAAKAQASAPQTDALRSRTPHWSLPRNAAVDGLSGHHLVVRLDQEGRVIGHADLYRAPSGTEFDARSIESCLALAPHLAQALDVARTLSAAEACARRYAECREMRVFGCLLLDDAGSIMEMNSKARAWLAAEDGLSIADGRLRAQLVSDDRAVEAWLRKALAEQESCGEGHVAVSRPSGRRPYVLVMRRIDSPPPPFGVCRPRVQLLIVDADRGSDMPREVLQALYGLTRAETEMAWHLVNGASIGETAQRLGIAHATARHHLERIFAKTGACRQSDLVRLALAPFLLLSRGE